MSGPSPPQVTEDFRSLDFEGLWAGRGSTTSVERALLAELLDGVRAERVLEIGPGSGRLTPVVRRRAAEYVALDLHEEFLDKVPLTPGPARSLKVVADLHHAPFVDGSFTALVVVRVYNFLPDPLTFLREASRLLVTGGHIVIGYQPQRSLATLVDDGRRFLDGRRAPGSPSMTFSSLPQVPAVPASFPTWLPTRRFVRSTLCQSGFEIERSLSSGLEDYSPGRRLPPLLFIRLAPLGDRLGFFPTQFVLARKSSEGPVEKFPPWSDMLACPACRTPFGTLELDRSRRVRCVQCGGSVGAAPGWVHARPGSDLGG